MDHLSRVPFFSHFGGFLAFFYPLSFVIDYVRYTQVSQLQKTKPKQKDLGANGKNQDLIHVSEKALETLDDTD